MFQTKETNNYNQNYNHVLKIENNKVHITTITQITFLSQQGGGNDIQRFQSDFKVRLQCDPVCETPAEVIFCLFAFYCFLGKIIVHINLKNILWKYNFDILNID